MTYKYRQQLKLPKVYHKTWIAIQKIKSYKNLRASKIREFQKNLESTKIYIKMKRINTITITQCMSLNLDSKQKSESYKNLRATKI